MLIQELMACSLVCRTWQEQTRKILFQIPITWSSIPLSVESHLKSDCLMQTFPPLRDLTLPDIGLSLQEIAELLQSLPSLDVLQLDYGIFPEKEELFSFNYTVKLLSLNDLAIHITITTLDTEFNDHFAVFPTFSPGCSPSWALWAIAKCIESKQSANLLNYTSPIKPFLHIKKMKMVNARHLCDRVLETVLGIFSVDVLYDSCVDVSTKPLLLTWNRVRTGILAYPS